MVPLLITIALLTQHPVDPSGHWEGAVQIPDMELRIEIDLVQNRAGELTGTFGQPADGLKGFPLSMVTIAGRTVRLLLKAGEQPAAFEGAIAADGKTLSGMVQQGQYSVPFALTRTGEARVVETPPSAAVGNEFEGQWDAERSADGRTQRITLTIANHADGRATGDAFSPDGSGVHVPIAFEQHGTSLTVRIPQIGAAFAGTLSPDGTMLSGTWSQQGRSLPVTFRRAAP